MAESKIARQKDRKSFLIEVIGAFDRMPEQVDSIDGKGMEQGIAVTGVADSAVPRIEKFQLLVGKPSSNVNHGQWSFL